MHVFSHNSVKIRHNLHFEKNLTLKLLIIVASLLTTVILKFIISKSNAKNS